jgi:hypothetical protein
LTTGADPKKLAILGVLVVVAGVLFYLNVFSSGDSGSASPAPRAAAVSPPANALPVPAPAASSPDAAKLAEAPGTRRGGSSRSGAAKNGGSTEIKFRQGSLRPEDRPDPTTIDPTLRLDLLAKVQNVEPEATMRNLFKYGTPAPPPAAAKPVPLPAHPPTIAINRPPPPPPPTPPGLPPTPSAPPMTFKYYGYKVSKADGRKEAFLLDGEDIIIAGENDAMKRGRYKVVKIGVNSITIEDTQFKSTQTLQLQEDAAA